ncbi:hypothetical protein GCK32_005416 [Trichostrongylus colubriformis]|uniref:Uncharacterized protein n=1 Tax=Trichostrongylus colubriformis TaxID=6319 RepID=A0AAN8FSI4_TRICO
MDTREHNESSMVLNEGATEVTWAEATQTRESLNVIWEEPEDLVTADDISSRMFSDPVITATEPPEACKTAQEREPLVLVGMNGIQGRVRRIRDWFEKKHRLGFSQTQMEEDDWKIEVSQT